MDSTRTRSSMRVLGQKFDPTFVKRKSMSKVTHVVLRNRAREVLGSHNSD